MILLEGLDATGKTTLADQLATQFPELTLRPSIGNKHDLDQIREQAYSEAHQRQDQMLMVADRSRIVSEYIYNPILAKREVAYPYLEWTSYLARFTMGRHVVVYCRQSLNDIGKVFHKQEQLEGVRENLPELFKAYEEFMTMLRFLFRVSGSGSVVVPYRYQDPGDRVMLTVQVQRYLKEVARERERLSGH